MANTGAGECASGKAGGLCFIDFLSKRPEERCRATPHQYRMTHSHPFFQLVENGDTGTTYTTLDSTVT